MVKKILIVLLTFFLVCQPAYAGLVGPGSAGGPATPDALCKVDSDTWAFCNSTDTFGDSTNKIYNGYFSDMTIDTLVIGDIVSGGLKVSADDDEAFIVTNAADTQDYFIIDTNHGDAEFYGEKVTFDGNVGIGATSPAQKLTVLGNIAVTGATAAIVEDLTYPVLYRADTGDGSFPFNIAGGLVLQSRDASTAGIAFATGAGPTVKMSILGDGSVGIGTTEPGAKLDVAGSASEGYLLIEDKDTGGSLTFAGLGDGWPYFYSQAGSYEYSFGILEDIDTDVFSINSANHPLVLATGYNKRLTIDTSGNVGIGAVAPDKKLEINSATGDCLRLTYNDNDGSASYYSDSTVSSSGDLTIAASGGDISFGDENLSTTGTLGCGSITSSGGLVSVSGITLNDDAATSYAPTRLVGAVMVLNRAPHSRTEPHALVIYKVNDSSSATILAWGSDNVVVSTGALTGTTGTDGKFTISADATDGKIYYENRLGTSVYFTLTYFGSL